MTSINGTINSMGAKVPGSESSMNIHSPERKFHGTKVLGSELARVLLELCSCEQTGCDSL